MVGGVATAIAVAGAYLLTLLVFFVNSVCNDPPSVVNGHRGSLRIWLIGVWLVAAGVPLVVSGLAKVRNRSRIPWFAAATVIGAVGLVLALSAQPTTWCLY